MSRIHEPTTPSRSKSSDAIGGSSAPRIAAAFVLGSAAAIMMSVPALAQIDSRSQAIGSFGGKPVQSDTAIESLPLAQANPKLTATTAVEFDAGDSRPEGALKFTVTVRNDGDVTVKNVHVSNADIAIDGAAGISFSDGFTPAGVDIPTGGSQIFTAVRDLGATDVYRAAASATGIGVSASATGKAVDVDVTSNAGEAHAAVEPDPRLAIAQTAELSRAGGESDGAARAGDTITYTYTVTNTGNVAIEGIAITDDHEGKTITSTGSPDTGAAPWAVIEATPDPLGLSADATEDDGSWDILGPGGAVTFTYVHTVTQEEFEAQ